jgi:uncharacterized delta-60 repeat protein
VDFTTANGFIPLGLVVQPADSKTIVAGFVINGSSVTVALVRFTASGALDTTFNGSGLSATGPVVGNDQSLGVALQSDGKIVVASTANAGGYDTYQVTRYKTDGTLDGTFGTGGTYVWPGDYNGPFATGVAIDGNGKIVVAGWEMGQCGPDISPVIRVTAAGALDTSFNNTGLVYIANASNSIDLYSVGIMPTSNDIVVGGWNAGAFGTWYVHANGTLAASYFGAGPSGSVQGAISLAVTSTGAVWEVGNDGSNGLALLSYPFGGGTPSQKVTNVTGFDYPAENGLALQSDGKVVFEVGTNYTPGQVENIAVLRYTTAGVLDPTFGIGGEALNIFSNTTPAYTYAGLAIDQAGGRIVACAQYRPQMDASFGPYQAKCARLWQ